MERIQESLYKYEVYCPVCGATWKRKTRCKLVRDSDLDWISQNLRKSIIEDLLSYLKFPAEAEKKSYEEMFSSGMSDIDIAHRKGIRLATVIENRIKIQGSKDISVIDGYITNGTEEPVYKEFVTNDYYMRLNGTISPYKAKSTERAVRNETGIHVDYISMMAVFYKILFNGHYMDASC